MPTRSEPGVEDKTPSAPPQFLIVYSHQVSTELHEIIRTWSEGAEA